MYGLKNFLIYPSVKTIQKSPGLKPEDFCKVSIYFIRILVALMPLTVTT